MIKVTEELCLHECYQLMSLEAVSEEDWLMLTLTVHFHWVNDTTESPHSPFMMSASSNKTASAFHCFTVFLPLNLLIMHDKEKTMLVVGWLVVLGLTAL